MKKIIAASVLSLMLIGVGSANAIAEFAMYYGREGVEPEECEEATIKGFNVKEEQNEHFSMGKETLLGIVRIISSMTDISMNYIL